MNILRHSNN